MIRRQAEAPCIGALGGESPWHSEQGPDLGDGDWIEEPNGARSVDVCGGPLIQHEDVKTEKIVERAGDHRLHEERQVELV